MHYIFKKMSEPISFEELEELLEQLSEQLSKEQEN